MRMGTMPLNDTLKPVGVENDDKCNDVFPKEARDLRYKILCCNATGATVAIALFSCVSYLAYVDCDNLALTIFVNIIFASYQMLLEIICIYGILYNNYILFKIKYFDPGVSIVAALVLSIVNEMQSRRHFPSVITVEPLKLWHHCICGIYVFFILVEMLHIYFLWRYYTLMSVDGYVSFQTMETVAQHSQVIPKSDLQPHENGKAIDDV